MIMIMMIITIITIMMMMISYSNDVIAHLYQKLFPTLSNRSFKYCVEYTNGFLHRPTAMLHKVTAFLDKILKDLQQHSSYCLQDRYISRQKSWDTLHFFILD